MAENISKLFPEQRFPEITPILKYALSFAQAFESSTFTIEHIILGYMRYIEQPDSKGNNPYKLFPWYTNTSTYLYATNLDKFSTNKSKSMSFEKDIYILSNEYKNYLSSMNMEVFFYLLMFLNINVFNSEHIVPYCSTDVTKYMSQTKFDNFLNSIESHKYSDMIHENMATCTSEREAWQTLNNGFKSLSKNAGNRLREERLCEKNPMFKSQLNIDLTTDITNLAYKEKLPEIVGRCAEINRIIDILAKSNKNNALILGESGVGKTSIVYGLAQKLLYDEVPSSLKNHHILEFNAISSIAGCIYRGSFEQKIQCLIDEISSSNEKIILYIDDIHTVVGIGGNEKGDTPSLGTLIKPLLSNSSIKIVGTSTYKGIRKVENNKSFISSFDTINVEETSYDETIQILSTLRKNFEKSHNMIIANSALETVVTLSKRYIPEHFLPDKAIDTLDSSCAIKRNMCNNEDVIELFSSDVIRAVSRITGIPETQIATSVDITNLEERLSMSIIGQDEAVSTISQTILRAQAGFGDENKPLGSFLFIGPTGVGKTELAKTLADIIFPGGRNNIIRLDMSEFMEKNSVSKIIGAAPGYIGYDESGQLTEKIKHHPYSLILLDEIEKAHPSILNILLQVLDEGWLTDSHGEKVNFRNTIIVMTSNAGSSVLYKNAVGFGNQIDSKSKDVMSELKKSFHAEFLNRIDDIVNFNSLTKNDILKIAKLIISTEITEKLSKKDIVIDNISNDVMEEIAKLGYSPEYGARFLKRTIQNKIATPLAKFMLTNNNVKSISINMDNSEIEITSTCNTEILI